MSILSAIKAKLECDCPDIFLRVSPEEMQVWSADAGNDQPQRLITTLREEDDELVHIEPMDAFTQTLDLPRRLERLIFLLCSENYMTVKRIERRDGLMVEVDFVVTYPTFIQCDNPACYANGEEYCENGHDHEGEDEQIMFSMMYVPEWSVLRLR
jgi:hypothetical protein